MTKQEKIQWKVAELHFDLTQKPYFPCAWEKLPLIVKAIYYKNAEEFLRLLQSQGIRLPDGSNLIEEIK